MKAVAARSREQHSGAEWALVALLAVAFVAFLPPVFEAATRSIAPTGADAKKLPGSACRTCGVIEAVQVVTLGTVKHDVSTVAGEGFAMFVALLSGKLGAGPVNIHAVTVRLQDGSMRVLHEANLPAWQPGDRVKVMMGRIRPAK